jgi:hypothetical protein
LSATAVQPIWIPMATGYPTAGNGPGSAISITPALNWTPTARWSNMVAVTKTNNFNTCLMWQPISVPSIPVPLKTGGWTWAGAGTRNSSGSWILTATNLTIVPPTNSAAFLQWTNLILPGIFTTNTAN